MNTQRGLIDRLIASATLAGCLLGLAPAVMAQSTDAPKPAAQAGAPQGNAATPKNDEGAPSADADREAVRARLTRQLEFVKQREQVLQSALEMLDQGKPLDELRANATIDWRSGMDRFRDRGGDRMRGDRGRWRGAQSERPPLGPEDIPRLMEFVQQHNPELAKDLHELREKDPEAFRAKLTELAPRLEWIMEGAKERPGRFKAMLKFREIDRRAHDLARKIADNPPDAPDLTLQLRQAVTEGFELRVKLGQFELQELQKRMQQWAESKDQMIDKRVKELIEGAKSGEPPPDDDMGGFPPERGPRRGPPGGPPPGSGGGGPG